LALQDSSEVFKPADVYFIDQPLLIRDAYRHVWNRCRAFAPVVLDAPDDVEVVLGLDNVYPLAQKAELPQPLSVLIPLDEDTIMKIQKAADVRRLLTERIYGAVFEAGLDPHRGLYIRGFYSSLKTPDPFYYFASNQEELEGTIFEVIKSLRESFEVGGIAVREMIDLMKLRLVPLEKDRPSSKVPFEFRVSFLGGRPIMINYHGPFEAMVPRHQRAILSRLKQHRDWIDRIRPLADRLAPLLPENFVADFAFYKDGEPVLIETNPLYSSGYNVPDAHAWLLSSLADALAVKAGYDAVDVRRSAEHLLGRPLKNEGAWSPL
jgi:hypothetical protein